MVASALEECRVSPEMIDSPPRSPLGWPGCMDEVRRRKLLRQPPSRLTLGLPALQGVPEAKDSGEVGELKSEVASQRKRKASFKAVQSAPRSK
ncbi:hypothetical protein AB1Y20_018202 [Prymnesium parvum]|uniref:Ribosome biogenesis protein NOP53 n=1 Tax=Prymnesium parvum TaxID=97485 RepID=A0AB34JR59_PRYPA